MKLLLQQIQKHHAEAVEGMFAREGDTLIALAAACARAIGRGNTLFFCGNGGSACDAMHIAGEFVGRFVEDRRALPAIALTADSGILTAVANDYGYDEVFARQVQALAKPGDVLIALSTSGKSPSVLRALDVAAEKGVTTALFTGEKVAEQKLAEFQVVVPSAITAHIQEAHHVALHALASLVEAQL